MFATFFLPDGRRLLLCGTPTWHLKDTAESCESSLSLCIPHPAPSPAETSLCLPALLLPAPSPAFGRAFFPRDSDGSTRPSWRLGASPFSLHADQFRTTTASGAATLGLAPGSALQQLGILTRGLPHLLTRGPVAVGASGRSTSRSCLPVPRGAGRRGSEGCVALYLPCQRAPSFCGQGGEAP